MNTQTLPTIVQAMQSGAYTIAGRLEPAMLYMSGLLFILVVGWQAVKIMLDEAGFAVQIAGIIRASFSWGLASWILTAWALTAGSVANGFQVATELATGASGVSPMSTIQQLISSSSTILNSMPSSPGIGQLFLHPVDSFTAILLIIQDWSAVAICFLFSLAAALVFFVQWMASNSLVCLALAIGPLFVPWLILDATRGWFDGYLRFLVHAGLYQLVAAVTIALLAPVTTFALQFATNQLAAGNAGTAIVSNTTNYILLCGFYAFQIYFLAKASAISGALAGSVHVGITLPWVN